MNHINTSEKVYCCGCHACEQRCPKGAISMIEDEEGFVYPQIDETTCINCGLCTKVCPIRSIPQGNLPMQTFFGKADDFERMNSSSGAAFPAIAKAFCNNNFAIYGAAFREDHSIGHIRIDSLKDLWMLRRSKYVQSDMQGIYHNVRQDLNEGRKVMFTGTPCQIAGLHTFLGGKQYNNLLTMDILCHSVPSPKVFRLYLSQKEKIAGKILQKVTFRDKRKCGDRWSSQYVTFSFSDGTVESSDNDLFMKGFIQGLYSRPSCYDCKFASSYRQSDITVGDYWGAKTFHPNYVDGKGLSLLMCNTKLGLEIVDKTMQEGFEAHQIPFEYAVKGNKRLTLHLDINPNRSAFFASLNNENIRNNMLLFVNIKEGGAKGNRLILLYRKITEKLKTYMRLISG